MANIYTPPNGHEVNLDLIEYTPSSNFNIILGDAGEISAPFTSFNGVLYANIAEINGINISNIQNINGGF